MFAVSLVLWCRCTKTANLGISNTRQPCPPLICNGKPLFTAIADIPRNPCNKKPSNQSAILFLVFNMSYFLNSIRKELNGIKSVGGWKAAWYLLLRECYVRYGSLVGTDKYGNKYYENNSFFFSRHRYVHYPYVDRFTYDASQVPSEWHRWLHYITDDPPTKVPPPQRKFTLSHKDNKTGTKMEYVPFSTTRPKIEEWVPPKGN